MYVCLAAILQVCMCVLPQTEDKRLSSSLVLM